MISSAFAPLNSDEDDFSFFANVLNAQRGGVVRKRIKASAEATVTPSTYGPITRSSIDGLNSRIATAAILQGMDRAGEVTKPAQVGGNHYAKMPIDVFQFTMANKLDPLQHSVVKYVTRFRDKGGIQDLEKAIHCLQRLIKHEQDK